ncbi:MAG: aminomethyl-transferring glycine dehydrogenase subunit GcvPB, partial [Firmicutes bacterium]|nr:aminomethyl-transferring glycine dehydrogenase subunit GcvPB [Bacillota bacterium]
MSRQTQDYPLIFELSRSGRRAADLPEMRAGETAVPADIPQAYLRARAPRLPEVSEVDLMRHYTGLSRRNHGVDSGFYPLGSCTMKYNPKRNEAAARIPGFADLHPYAPANMVQGALALMYRLQVDLAEITGMDEVSLQPAAGAAG